MIGKRLDRLFVLYRYWLTRRRMSGWTDRASLERWQEKRVTAHLARVRRESPYFRELWANRDLSQWREFPIIDKTAMMNHFDRLNTAGIRKEEAFALALRAERTRDFTPMIGGVTIGLSSGTSGNRGLFVVSKEERLAWAGTMLAKVLPGSVRDEHRIAFFLRADSNLYGTVKGGRLQFAFYDLLDPLSSHLARLGEQKPTLLVAPPSMLRLLADKRRDGALSIRPARIVSIAEALDPLDRIRIEESFGQTVHQVYQCTEGCLGSTCAYGTVHIHEDLVVIQKEYVDRKLRKFVPIVTDFSRRTQPIVRYRLNDLLTGREEPCPCGSPFLAIESIEGRCDDLFYFPASDGTGWVRVFPDFIARAVLSASERIEAYRVVLHAPDRMTVQLGVDPAYRAETRGLVAQSFAALCARLGCRMPAIEFDDYDFVPGSVKLRRVERRFEHVPEPDLVR
ncbi:F390 synthetase-related protein [Paenibacillus flagellatus]|uniref:Adenylate cyclase n=1 Tax=Paenibacillus flagellatus TaxID=2211139 RepID=A0A2V5KZF7_9BACL|nr:F390 synthetase-related protein [Paenibacillus flagellatus]PYI55506.1 adenylate cyclase [Paenibacillus flagellatus]